VNIPNLNIINRILEWIPYLYSNIFMKQRQEDNKIEAECSKVSMTLPQ
jgi:hypothetical protein